MRGWILNEARIHNWLDALRLFGRRHELHLVECISPVFGARLLFPLQLQVSFSLLLRLLPKFSQLLDRLLLLPVRHPCHVDQFLHLGVDLCFLKINNTSQLVYFPVKTLFHFAHNFLDLPFHFLWIYLGHCLNQWRIRLGIGNLQGRLAWRRNCNFGHDFRLRPNFVHLDYSFALQRQPSFLVLRLCFQFVFSQIFNLLNWFLSLFFLLLLFACLGLIQLLALPGKPLFKFALLFCLRLLPGKFASFSLFYLYF